MVESIWHEYREALLGFIRKRVDALYAEDLLQDVFIKVHSKVDTLEDSQKIESWLYQITRNAITDFYRSHKVDRPIPQWHEEDDEHNEEVQELCNCLVPLIKTLPKKYQEVLLLSEIQRESQQAVADALSITLTCAKSRIQRGRDMLKGVILGCCTISKDSTNQVISCERKSDSCGEC